MLQLVRNVFLVTISLIITIITICFSGIGYVDIFSAPKPIQSGPSVQSRQRNEILLANRV